MNTKNNVLCKVCHQKQALYICPKCNADYCSLECYKKHGDTCTENFYNSQVFEEMNLRQKEDKEMNIKKMNEILSHLNDLDTMPMSYESNENNHDMYGSLNPTENEEDQPYELEEEEEEEIDEETIAHLIDLAQSDKISIDDLPISLQKLFEKDIKNGVLNEEIPVWIPWWKESIDIHHKEVLRRNHKLIQIINQDTDEDDKTESIDHLSYIPCIENASIDIPMLPSLPSTISPCVLYNTLSILYSYCLTLWKYNGDYSHDIHGCFTCFWELAYPFSNNINYYSIEEALQPCIEKCVQSSLFEYTNIYTISILTDVVQVLTYKHYVLDIFYDIYRIIQFEIDDINIQISSCKTEHSKEYHKYKQYIQLKNDKKMLLLVQKKISFYYSYIQSKSQEDLWQLDSQVDLFKRERLSMTVDNTHDTNQKENPFNIQKDLIQEQMNKNKPKDTLIQEL
ncbi:hypothetical protein WA158_005733 [Blastocystis sp. Blastoise]